MAKKQKIGGSLQDQLRKAGLVTEKQLRRAEKGKHKKDMQVKHGQAVDEDKLAAQNAKAAKAEQDRQLNEEQQRVAGQRALIAQVKQLIDNNSKLQDGDLAYNFVELKKVKKIFVSSENQLQLNKGYLAIVKTDKGYQLVPEKVARKIMERTEDVVLYLYERAQEVDDEDDPYNSS